MGVVKTGTAKAVKGTKAAATAAQMQRGPGANLTLMSLPPDLLIKAFTFLPVPDLANLARCSRRIKILVYNDDVYDQKLKCMEVQYDGGCGTDENIPAASSSGGDAEMNRISSKIKQLPGANMFAGATYLETGSLWGGLTDPAPTIAAPAPIAEAKPRTSEESTVANDSAVDPTSPQELPSTAPTSPDIDSSLTPAAALERVSTAEDRTATQPRISAVVPSGALVKKKSHITIGHGGLLVASRSSSGISIGGRRPDIVTQRTVNGLRPREAFKLIYTELQPYFSDFRTHQKDSKVFRDHKDLIQIASLLRRLRRFAAAKFIVENLDDVQFSLETTIEWFESMVLGQFERAYDLSNVPEMRRNAMACVTLNGGAACVQLFISKNPIFFDQTFNPTLIPSLASSSSSNNSNAQSSFTKGGAMTVTEAVVGDATGYALAETFAKFMDHTLTSCRSQAELILKIFGNAAGEAITTFLTRVFDDSIQGYLTSILDTARDKEPTPIYLHTMATAVYCSIQFLDYVSAFGEEDIETVNKPTIRVDELKIKLVDLFKVYTDQYMDLEVRMLTNRFDAEIGNWNKRREKAKRGERRDSTTHAPYLGDAEKAQAHKRKMMSAMKAVLFAPMALGKTLALMGSKKIANGSDKDSEAAIAKEKDVNGAATYYLDDDSIGSLVSVELCLNLMHANKEALGRALVITSAVDMPKLKQNVGIIFCMLFKAIGGRHMSIAFETAINRLSDSKAIQNWDKSQSSVNFDSLQFFELIHIADLIHQMVELYYQEDVKPWIDESDFLSELMVEKKAYDHSSDDNVASGMDKVIQVLITQVDVIMDGLHSPADYNPPGKDVVLDVSPTKSCQGVITCLDEHVKLLTGTTSQDTLEVFLGELGVRLFNVICKNLKKWQVSPRGAMQLICDLNRYHQWSCQIRVYSVSRLFLVLKELGNLYLAEGGNDLRNLVHDAERYQGVLRPEEIYELMSARTDWKKIKQFVETKDCIVM